MGVKYFRDVVIGGMSRQAIWSAGRNGDLQFVDGDYGGTIASTSGSSGRTPKSAVTTVTLAINNIQNRQGVIYVRPRGTVASAQSYYQEDIVVPLTKPGLHIVGAVPDGCTGAQGGPQFKPLTVTGHLIDVKGANLTLENLRLTLSGGTAVQNKCIVHAVTVAGGATTKPSGLTIRNCRFENDKSYASYSGTEAVASIGLGTCNDTLIENNMFHNCIAGVAIQETSGIPHNIQIKGNTFSGAPSVRDCDILASWGDGTGLLIIGNYFADGLPATSSGNYKRFVEIIGAGTGLLANNFFAAYATNSSDLFDADGALCLIPDTFFQAHNYFLAGTANYGLGDRTT
jgi:hypothetical protein